MNTDEIVETMLSDQFNDVDVTDYMDESDMSEAFTELLATYASYKYDRELTHLENSHERLTQIGERLEKLLTHYVSQANRRVA